MKRPDEKKFDTVLANARDEVLNSALIDVPFDGWTKEVMDKAIANSGVMVETSKLAFPKGLRDLVAHFHRRGDAELAELIPQMINFPKGITARVETCILERFRLVMKDKESVRKASAFFMLPLNASKGAGLMWETCDLIWRLTGITDKGFSFYSRRLTLMTIYSATFLYWLQDDDPNMEATKLFLSRRLSELGKFHKVKAKFLSPFQGAR